MTSIHYTSEQTADNGEVIKGRITELTGSGGYLIEILANGMAIIAETFTTSRDETTARGMAYIAAASYIFRLNNPGFGQTDAPAASASPIIEDAPMSDMPDAVDAGGDVESLAVALNTALNSDFPAELKGTRIGRIRQRIERLEIELKNARAELASELR